MCRNTTGWRRGVTECLALGVAIVLLASGTAGAHTQSLPTCSGLPADQFFSDNATAATNIANGTAIVTLVTAPGTGETGEGQERFRYAKITLPALSAGELRVFSTDGAPADAILCHGSSRHAYYQTTYDAEHNREERAARTARTNEETTRQAAITLQQRIAAIDTTTDQAAQTRVNSAIEDSARTQLHRAAGRLDTAVTALRNAGLDTTATAGAAQAARNAADNDVTAENDNPADEITALYGTITIAQDGTVTTAIDSGSAAQALITAAETLEGKVEDDHSGFALRAKVSAGVTEFILVTVQSDPENAVLNRLPDEGPDLGVQFHGAISTASRTGDIEESGDVGQHEIAVTAPGLLTVTTTGSTDTKGELTGITDARSESGGSGGNFRLAVPIAAAGTHTLRVSEQSDAKTGPYDLDMEFAVAMGTTATATGVTPIAVSPWSSASPDMAIGVDDGIEQIKRRSEDGNQADQDIFVFTIGTSSGFLVVKAEDATEGTPSNTDGIFYGPYGQIQAATGSGHFRFRAPAKAANIYAVAVTGSDGTYRTAVEFDAVGGTTNQDLSADDPTRAFPVSEALTARGTNAEKDRHRYLFTIAESGTLYLQTTGETDVLGLLYGPDGSLVKRDDNSGKDRNFRIVASVKPGLYLLTVEGKNPETTGTYQLTANFAAGVTDDEPGDTDDDTSDTIDDDDDDDRDDGGTAQDTLNPVGSLDEPAPNSFRSGIGVLRGWVCNAGARGVQIRLTNTRTNAVTRIDAPNGSDRGDVNVQRECDHRNPNVGFAVQFNYNLLPAGEYTAEAFIGTGRAEAQIGLTTGGQTNTFGVVRISDDEYLTAEALGLEEDDDPIECEVPNFPPDTRQRVILGWDEASQNFQIMDTE